MRMRLLVFVLICFRMLTDALPVKADDLAMRGIEISGTCPDTVKMVYIRDYVSVQPIDSVVPSDGKFSYTAKVNEKYRLFDILAGEREYVVFADGTPVVNCADNTLKGSPLNVKLNGTMQELISLSRRSVSAMLTVMMADKNGQSFDREAEKEIKDILRANTIRAVTLMRKTLEENLDNMIPAAIIPMLYKHFTKDEAAKYLAPERVYYNNSALKAAKEMFPGCKEENGTAI